MTFFYFKLDPDFQNIKRDVNTSFSETIAILIDLNFHGHLGRNKISQIWAKKNSTGLTNLICFSSEMASNVLYIFA